MSEKKLVSLPKVFHVSARRPDPTIAPANQSSIARDYKASNLITTESKPNAKGASAESIAMSIQPNNSIAKKQGVYIQLPSRSAQPCSSSSSSVLQNILQSTPVQMEALLGAATTPQKTISPSISQSVDTASEILDIFEDATELLPSSLNELKTESNERSSEIQKGSQDKAIQCSYDWIIRNSVGIQCDLGKLYDGDQKSMDDNKTENPDNDDDLFYCTPDPKTYQEKCKEIENNFYECLDCGKKDIKKKMFRHVHLHTEKSVLCQYCGKICTDRSSLANHELRSHRTPPLRRKTPRNERTCPYCNKYSKSIIAHTSHVNSHTGEKTVQCICGATFGSQYSLYSHRKVKGCLRAEKTSQQLLENSDEDKVEVDVKEETSPEIKTEIIEETETGDTFIIKMEVDDAEIVQEEDQQKNRKKSPNLWTCNVCNKVLKSEYMYTRHKTTHEENRLKCVICNCSYNSRRVLTAHIRVQHLNKIRCNICNKLVSKAKYKAHESRHNEYKPHECNICKRKFLTMGGLRTHRLCNHEGKIYDTRAINCFFCGFHRNNFKTHMQSKFHQEKEDIWKKMYKIDSYPCCKCNDTYFQNILELCQHTLQSHKYYLHKNLEEYCKKLANIWDEPTSKGEGDDENSKESTDTAEECEDVEALSCDKNIFIKKEFANIWDEPTRKGEGGAENSKESTDTAAESEDTEALSCDKKIFIKKEDISFEEDVKSFNIIVTDANAEQYTALKEEIP